MQVHIDDVIFGGHGKAFPSMPKEAIKTFKLKIDYGSFGGCVQTYPGMPKEAFKTLISQKLMKV